MNAGRIAPARASLRGTGPSAAAKGAAIPRVLHAPGSRAAILRGMAAMAALVRPTLGPLPRTVVIAGQTPRATPEVLDHAATVLRRTIAIADPFADMGAMLARHLAWAVYQRAGDGAATAVVLAQAILRAAAPAVAAGADPQAVRRGIARGLATAREELRRQARPVDAAADLARVVAGIVREPGVAATVAEVVEAIGPEGAALIEDWQGMTTTAEYIDGLRWHTGLLSPYLLDAGAHAGRIEEPRILATDLPLAAATDLLPALEACIAAGERTLLVVAPAIGGSALGLLLANRARGVLAGALAVRAPGEGEQRARILEDIAVATGGRAFLAAAGARLADVTIADLGRAHHAWAMAGSFGILGGQGEKAAIRQRIAAVKAELRATPADDERERKRIRERIGKLAGTAAIIYVGAPTESARAELHARIEAAVTAAQATLREGAVPGGGAAFAACVPALARLAATRDGAESLGVRALARALPEPMAIIAANAGLDPGALLGDDRASLPGWTYDAVRREWVAAWAGGIIDPLPVALAALEGAVSAATMALTTETLVRHKKPETAKEP